jgi:ribosomal subunit interface protein
MAECTYIRAPVLQEFGGMNESKTFQNDSASIPYQITFRHMASSEAVWLVVQERVTRLERFQTRSTHCEVIICKPHHHKTHGQGFHVEIRLHVPGKAICITRDPEVTDDHADVYIAIRDAFNALERKVEEFMRVRRGNVKYHEEVRLKSEPSPQ